jgi:GNAT superfamily N-acetyltransferase
MTPDPLLIRRMRPEDVRLAINWAAEEGWNPGLNDAECFRAADPDGFFIGEVDGRRVGCISAVAYGPDFGFIGLFLVRREFRGHEIGPRLGQAALRYLGARNIGQDGVLAKVPIYAKLGFRLACSNARYRGSGIAAPAADPAVVELAGLPFAALAEFDRRYFPAPREAFLRAWIAQPGARALARLDARGDVIGYGVARPCRVGHKIGPLFAADAATAQSLLTHLAAVARGGPVFLDIPEPNVAAVELVTRHRMEKVFATARMYTQAPPPVDLAGLYGVTSFELG